MQEATKVKIIEEAKRIENDALYSAKGHYEEANHWANFHLLLGIPIVVTSATAGASALAPFDNHNIIAAILALIVACLTGVMTFLNPNEKASSHQTVGNKYNALRNRTRTFYNLDVGLGNLEQKLVEQLKDLIRQRDELNEESPPIPDRAYRRAKKKIINKASLYRKSLADQS